MDRLPDNYWMTDEDVKSAEFAPGIANRREYGDPSQLQVGELVPYVQQLHHALRAKRHYDVRLGKDKMLSWATKKELPRPGDRPIALWPQPLHDESYSKFQGRIQTGYGAGTVRPVDLGKVMITQADPDKIKFVVAHKKTPEEFTLIRMQANDDKRPAWLMVNSTPTEGPKYQKEHYKLIDAEEIDKLFDPKYVMSAKIDGASALVNVLKDRVDVLSLRPNKEGGPIVHTHRMGLAGQKLDIPKELQNTLLRGEIYGTRDGTAPKSIAPQELGGILNSTVENSIRTQKEKGIKLRLALFGASQVGGKPWQGKTHEETRQIIQGALKHLPADIFGEPPYANTEAEKRKMWESITSGNDPLTREGVVGFPVEGGRPVKVKPVSDYDVHIRSVFPQVKGDTGLAGGFDYSMDAGGPVAGRVGTGFSREERQRMMASPEEYIGRVARVQAQEQFPSGALRAPAYIARHEDYPATKAAQSSTAELAKSTPADANKVTRTCTGRVGKFKVCEVDGTEVRNNCYVDFVQGGNSERYKFIPQGEIWVERNQTDAEKRMTVLHELIEATKMSHGESYDKAHDETAGVERKLRHAGAVPAEKAAKLTLVSGFLGSGKSTTAKRMAKDESAKYVSIDVLRTSNRDKKLEEFMSFLEDKARAYAKSDDNVIMEGIHAAKLPADVQALAARLVKVPTSEAESTVRAIKRNIERSKKPESKMYGWSTMKVIKNVVENQIRFRKAVEAFGQTKAAAEEQRSIGIDFDGTLSEYHGWKGHAHTGKPVPKMLARVKRMLAAGEKVKIFTARAADGKKGTDPVRAWCKKYLGRELEVTNEKDHLMKKIIDDKAEGVVKNTGESKSAAFTEDKDPDLNMAHRRFNVVEDGKPVGRVIASKKVRGPAEHTEVTGLYVDPDRRGTGIARKLIDRVQTEHPGSTLSLKPRPFADKLLDDEELVKVYERLGFTRSGKGREMTREANYKSSMFKMGLEAASAPSFDALVGEAQPAVKTVTPAVPAKPVAPVKPSTPDWSAYRKQVAGVPRVYPKFKINPDVMTNAAKSTYERTGRLIPAHLAVAQGQLETQGATKGRHPQTNPYNVTEYDKGTGRHFPNQAAGVQSYYDLMANDYLTNNKTVDDLLKRFVNASGKRYATDPNYTNKLRNIIQKLKAAGQ